jgi:hypothetical protein
LWNNRAEQNANTRCAKSREGFARPFFRLFHSLSKKAPRKTYFIDHDGEYAGGWAKTNSDHKQKSPDKIRDRAKQGDKSARCLPNNRMRGHALSRQRSKGKCEDKSQNRSGSGHLKCHKQRPQDLR